MGKLRTSEQLKQLFQQTKERKQKELQRKKEEKKKQYKELCKQADQLLKEDEEKRKMEKIEQLKSLSKKVRKPSYYFMHNSRYIEEEAFWWADPNINREKLQEMEKEPSETGRINWQKWDEICSKPLFPNGMPKYAEQPTNPPKRGKIQITVIDERGDAHSFPSISKAAEAYNMFQASMQHLLKTGKMHKTLKIQVYENN